MANTIMVVEDESELSEVLEYNLRRAGYHVVQATDGLQAMEKIRQEPPDLLLLDLMLPGADGWEVCRYLSQHAELRTLPIIIFTARSTREDFDQARQFNLAGFFTKPYATADVVRHVEKVLERPSQVNP